MSKTMETKDKILKSLKVKKRTITELSEELGLSKSTVSQHLYELIDSGLIEEEPNDHFKKLKYFRLRSKEGVNETAGMRIRLIGAAVLIVAVVSIFAIVLSGGSQNNANDTIVKPSLACPMLPYYSTANYSDVGNIVLNNAEGNQCFLTYVNTKSDVIDVGNGVHYSSYDGTLSVPSVNYTYKMGPKQVLNIENAADEGNCWAYKTIEMFNITYSGNATNCKSEIIN
ncbi:ArsR family transcriptional regulator [Candidatus Mancarchaeum acidiphilum]|uniref:ArsR family transcriptional regulator n=1 Tax=Candidatus Mancarchaeum acidiphilum TaxID=1920749 RepID=A0A218NND1_9ARCH|nr:winged helix-turn-helix domain-containing protein [Candidatus Mancarchaeum acidiphilum]ASI13988.1 ArsR family transcriptional regulator [Candidatus Mancarchaeum acidiphilum]